METELSKSRLKEKANVLRDELSARGKDLDENKKMHESTFESMSREITNTKQALTDTLRREKQVNLLINGQGPAFFFSLNLK